MSLFHSVDPSRHGTTTNTYMPQVHPVEGLCEVLSRNKKRCAMFYSWEQLRDITKPGSLDTCTYIGSAASTYDIALLSEKVGWNTTLTC